MRTLSSTFATAEEAEAARSRLYLIGVSPDNIMVRDLGEAGGAEQGIFLSAKVAPDQVSRANAILSAAKKGAPEPEAPPLQAEAPTRPAFISKGPREQVTPPQAPRAAPAPAPVARAEQPDAPAAAAPAHRDARTPASRLLVIFALIIVAGLLFGYLIGTATQSS